MTMRVVEDDQPEANAAIDQRELSRRKVEFDYLRAFAVVLVLCHHAILAYSLSAFINFENPIATSSPVVNEQRWPVFDLIVAYNETFLMPLLFFVSGLFVWQSLARKGARKYLEGRLTRLGIPFVIGVVFLVPLAYYPAQLQIGPITGVNSRYGAFWLEMVRSGFGTGGPSLVLVAAAGIRLLGDSPVPSRSFPGRAYQETIDYYPWQPRTVSRSTAWNLNRRVSAYGDHFRAADVDWNRPLSCTG